MKVIDRFYLTSSKEDARWQYERMCKVNGIEVDESALDMVSYACYEVGIDVEWDTETGECRLLGTCTDKVD